MTVFALLLSLLACNRQPCQDYVEAFNECYDTLNPDSNNRLESGYCADYDATSDDYFTCLADSYSSGDCTSDAGIAEIDSSVAECSL